MLLLPGPLRFTLPLLRRFGAGAFLRPAVLPVTVVAAAVLAFLRPALLPATVVTPRPAVLPATVVAAAVVVIIAIAVVIAVAAILPVAAFDVDRLGAGAFPLFILPPLAGLGARAFPTPPLDLIVDDNSLGRTAGNEGTGRRRGTGEDTFEMRKRDTWRMGVGLLAPLV